MPSRSSRAIKSAAATSFVFLNCPFDDQYKPIFEALVFTIHACGFTARCALEDGGSERVFEKFYLGASRLSMRRMAARSMKASEVWTFNS